MASRWHRPVGPKTRTLIPERGVPEVAAKKKKAAQYGSGAMNLFRKIAKKKGVTVSDMVREMSGHEE